MPSRAKTLQHFANQIQNVEQFATADYETNVQNTQHITTEKRLRTKQVGKGHSLRCRLK